MRQLHQKPFPPSLQISLSIVPSKPFATQPFEGRCGIVRTAQSVSIIKNALTEGRIRKVIQGNMILIDAIATVLIFFL